MLNGIMLNDFMLSIVAPFKAMASKVVASSLLSFNIELEKVFEMQSV